MKIKRNRVRKKTFLFIPKKLPNTFKNEENVITILSPSPSLIYAKVERKQKP